MEAREDQMIETFEAFLVQYKGQMIRNARYDHFFNKWDNLKGWIKNFWVLSSGSIITAILGAFGFWFQRRRYKKKNGEKH